MKNKQKNRMGIEIETKTNSLKIEFDGRMIKKGGRIKLFFDNNNIPSLDLSEWYIEDNRIFSRIRKNSIGLQFSGGSLICSGETKNDKLFDILEHSCETCESCEITQGSCGGKLYNTCYCNTFYINVSESYYCKEWMKKKDE